MKILMRRVAARTVTVLCTGALTLVVANCGTPKVSTFSTTQSRPAARPAATNSAQMNVTSAPTVLTDEQRARGRALAPRAEAILAAYANVDPVLSPDGKRILFRSDRDGVWEAYIAELSKPDEPPQKVISGPARVRSARFSPDGKWIVFTRDEGGDENYRIFRANLDGTSVVNLTPSETTKREGVFLPRKQRDRMVYSTRDAGSPETRVVVQELMQGGPKVVHTDAGPGYLLGGDQQGTHALLIRFVSLGEQILFDVELTSGKSRRVYPAEGASASVFDAAFSADGSRIFVATDEGKEGSSLIALDARTFAEQSRYRQDDPATATIAGLTVSAALDRIAIAIEAGSVRTARILDARTLQKTVDVQLPPGVVDLGTFSEDGKMLTFAASLADRPMDIYVADANDGQTRLARHDRREGIDALPAITATVAHVKSFDGLVVPMNVYLPVGSPNTKRPTIVEFHGGPEGSSHLFWKTLNRFFTAQGYAYVEPNIRGSSGFGRAYEMADNRERRPDAFRDMEAVNHWLREQPWCDDKRIVILGESYGGYLTLIGLTRQPELWAAGVDLFGPSNLVTFLRAGSASARKVYAGELGDVDKDTELLEQLSPSHDWERVRAPLFVFQGTNDSRVPRSESDQLVLALRKRGLRVEYMLADDEGHSIDLRANRVEFLTRIARFLNDELADGTNQ